MKSHHVAWLFFSYSSATVRTEYDWNGKGFNFIFFLSYIIVIYVHADYGKIKEASIKTTEDVPSAFQFCSEILL